MTKRFISFLVAMLALWFCPLQALALVKVQEIEVAGLKIWLAEDHHLPVVHVQLLFQGAGAISDPKGQQGRAALAAAMLTEGAGALASSAFHRALEEKAIGFEVEAGRDHLSVNLRTLSEHNDAAFALLADTLLRPRFDDRPLREAKKRFVISRRHQQESPYYLADKALREKAYGAHPYAREFLGSDASMQALTREHLRNYQRRVLAKSNVIISVAGSITPLELKKLVFQYLKELPDTAQLPVLAAATFPEAPIHVSIERELPQTLWLFVHKGLARSDAQFYAAYVLNHILGGSSSLTSRLGQEVREKRGLSYGIGTALEEEMLAQRWSGMVSTQNETADEAKQVIEATLADLAANGVSEEELRAAKDYIRGSFPLQLTSNADVASFLTVMQLYQLGSQYLEQRNAYFEAVTLEAVQAVAKAMLLPEAWSWVRVGGKPPEKPELPKPSQEATPAGEAHTAEPAKD